MADYFLKKRYNSPERSNLILARGSIVFLVAGCLLMALSYSSGLVFLGELLFPPQFLILTYFRPAIFISTCGGGYMPALRSFMTSLVPRDDTALLFALVGVFDSIGSLAGAPLLSLSFSAGIKMGGIWIGLPFFCAAAIYGLSGISIWMLRPPSSKVQGAADEHEQDD